MKNHDEQRYVLTSFNAVENYMYVVGVFKTTKSVQVYIEDTLSLVINERELSALHGFAHATFTTKSGEIFNTQKFNVY
jgi:hypothetical protein